MRHLTRWPSEQAEMLDLLDIVKRNCLCPAQVSLSDANHGVCAAHELLLGDQQAINRLVFVRSIADRLRAEEWSESV